MAPTRVPNFSRKKGSTRNIPKSDLSTGARPIRAIVAIWGPEASIKKIGNLTENKRERGSVTSCLTYD